MTLTQQDIEHNTELLIQASERGELLIPVSNPLDNNSAALRWAAEGGHIECVKLLLPVSNPKDLDSQALQTAVIHGHTECIKLLLPVSDYPLALQESIGDTALLQQCIETYENECRILQQKQRLTHILNAVQDTKINSTKRKL